MIGGGSLGNLDRRKEADRGLPMNAGETHSCSSLDDKLPSKGGNDGFA